MRFSILNSRRKQELELFHHVPATLRCPRQITTIDASGFLNPKVPRYNIGAKNGSLTRHKREALSRPGQRTNASGVTLLRRAPSGSESRHLGRGKPHDLHQGGDHANQGKEGLALLKRTISGQVVPRYLTRV